MLRGAGMQGIGVRTPRAAAVAEAVAGKVRDVQFPQGLTFVIGVMSFVVSTGAPPILIVDCDISCPGVVPLEQAMVAPETTG